MAKAVAGHLRCPESEVLTGSTGVIGKKMDMPAIHAGIDAAFADLAGSIEAARRAEQAIMTTDLVPKSCVVEFELEGILVRVAGMAKGSGMIHPDMATMIGVITTDCAVDATTLQHLPVGGRQNLLRFRSTVTQCLRYGQALATAAGNPPIKPDIGSRGRRNGKGQYRVVAPDRPRWRRSNKRKIRVDGARNSDAYRARSGWSLDRPL